MPARALRRTATMLLAIAAFLVAPPAAATLAPRPAFRIADPGGVAPLYPAGGDVAPGGTRYVADSGRSRIVAIDDRGRQAVVSGAGAGWNDPRDLEVDVRRPRFLWVANTSAKEVVKLDRDGSIELRVGGFEQLYGLANDRRGVYVADTYANRVVKIAKGGAERWSVAGCFGDGFGRPRDVAIGSNDDVYVADTDNDRIVRLDPATGACLDAFGTPGSAQGQLNAPRALTSDGRGGLWIAEGGNQRIQRFSLAGVYTNGSAIGGFGNRRGEFRSAHCVFMDGRLVSVCDTFNFRIQRFRVDGDGRPSFHSLIGGRPPARGGFNGPFDVAYGPGGAIYVADWFNHRIQRFTKRGDVVWARGRYGTPGGSFIFPRGVAVDGSTLVVTDSENSRIDLLDAGDGSFLEMIKPVGTSLLRPHQTAVTAGGTYWVADTGNQRLLHLGPSGAVLANSASWPDGGQIDAPPRGIAVDPSGNVYASSGNRVLKFSSDGALVDVLASFGSGPAQVVQPYGLRIVGDPGGLMLLVADRGNDRVLALELDGTPIASFGSGGTGDGRFAFPQGVDMHEASGRIAVADFGNDRISVWRS